MRRYEGHITRKILNIIVNDVNGTLMKRWMDFVKGDTSMNVKEVYNEVIKM